MKKGILAVFQAFTLERVTIFMGTVGHLASYIQAFKIVYLGSSHAVSLLAYLIGWISITCWLLYGISRNIKPLIISNVFGIFGMTFVIWAILIFP